ncbi:rho GTPase-activating protein SYDE1 [Lampris incognitus]|uniref:rho GTPase-activating protein SYDE1 n=1 Tax=Lampris incognitus TaxID=2546036 RepID=UPI0024B56A79|nr:rho GTPase-activating protein SYDE1 [Lampris incognitus]
MNALATLHPEFAEEEEEEEGEEKRRVGGIYGIYFLSVNVNVNVTATPLSFFFSLSFLSYLALFCFFSYVGYSPSFPSVSHRDQRRLHGRAPAEEDLLPAAGEKDRSRRKTDPKITDVPGKSESIAQTSSSPSPSSSSSPPRNHITVAKKQQWARQASVGRDPSTNAQATCPAYNAPSWDNAAGKSQAGPGLAWSQRLAEDKREGRGDRSCVGLGWDPNSTPCHSANSAVPLQEHPQPVEVASHLPVFSTSAKLSGQGAYLQSLERSSRAWVLSSGKSQASDEASRLEVERTRMQGENNIWYNPIPEEEDGGTGGREGSTLWRRRKEEEEGGAIQRWAGLPLMAGGSGGGGAASGGMGAGSGERDSSDCQHEGASANIGHLTDDITAEFTEPHCELPPSDSSPSSQKKGGGSSSMIDRLKSPVTVRKLSMKMKKLPELRRKLSLRSSRSQRHGNDGRGGGDEGASTSKEIPSAANQNVISRYHLDSSAPPARPLRRSSRGRSASKGGYLSDGDSPELLPRQQAAPLAASQDGGCDVSSFRLYVGSDQPRCAQRVTGLLTVHLLGLEEMTKACRSESSKEVFLAIQIDGITRARTALLTLRGPALSLNHTFHLVLERARQIRLVVLTPHTTTGVGGTTKGTNQTQTSSSSSSTLSSSGPTKNRVCCLGGVSIPPLFKASRCQQLCVKLEPRGLLYVKLSLQEQWESPSALPQANSDPLSPSSVFGVELHILVEREGRSPPVPLLIQKTVAEIERRGLKVVGLYRLCGSAAVKKELRDWFERNSLAVCLSEDLYPDINVITGILKDYLRELPSPLITRALYEVVLEAMTLRPAPAPSMTPDPLLAQRTVALLDCLPAPERATLSLLLDHLSLVASFSLANRMTHQNLAVCFGPVLLTPTQEAWRPGGGAREKGRGFSHSEDIASAVDFKRHIEALHYLLQLWPVPVGRGPADLLPSPPPSPPSPVITHNPLGQQLQRRAALRLALPQKPEEEVVVSRRGRGLTRLESPPPINRYAGDWSVCGRDFLSGQDADYDEVAGTESEGGSEEEEEEEKRGAWSSKGLYVEEFGLDFDAPFSCRLSLKDFDTLIHDLDRELAKQINICL